MALTLADVGADCILKTYFNNTRPAGGNNFTLKLFTSDTTPADTDTAGTYTEANGGGYAAITLTNGSFTVTVGNDPSDAVYAQQTFSFSGALTGNLTVFGYFIVDADGVLQWAERLAASYTPVASGTLKVTVKFQLSKGTPA